MRTTKINTYEKIVERLACDLLNDEASAGGPDD